MIAFSQDERQCRKCGHWYEDATGANTTVGGHYCNEDTYIIEEVRRPQPKPPRPPVNRHERRKAVALQRRGG